VRHGETDSNREGRIQGHLPTSLNATGQAQAVRLAGYFAKKPFAAVYSSDLPRAMETAQAIARPHGLGVVAERDLRERSLGPYEGRTSAEIETAIRAYRASAGQGDLADWTGVPGVEGDESVWQRVSDALKRIALAYPGQDVLIVTHGGVLSRVMWKTLGIANGHPRRFPLSNGITLIVTYKREAFHLLSLVDMPLLLEHQIEPDTATGPQPTRSEAKP
jgi:probable phosphoglycerate mutase